MVNKPGFDEAHQDHYESLGIEPIDYIKATFTPEEFQAFCRGNVIKYISRYQLKNGIEDVRKADVYLGWMLESMEEGEEVQSFLDWNTLFPTEDVSELLKASTPDGLPDNVEAITFDSFDEFEAWLDEQMEDEEE